MFPTIKNYQVERINEGHFVAQVPEGIHVNKLNDG